MKLVLGKYNSMQALTQAAGGEKATYASLL